MGATVFIASMIDATFDLPDEHENRAQNVRLSNTPKSPQKPESQNKTNTSDAKPDTPAKNKKTVDTIILRLRNQLTTLATALSSMNDSLNFLIPDIYFNLSKCNKVVKYSSCVNCLIPLIYKITISKSLFWPLTKLRLS